MSCIMVCIDLCLFCIKNVTCQTNLTERTMYNEDNGIYSRNETRYTDSYDSQSGSYYSNEIR